jgi:hypothetical protein
LLPWIPAIYIKSKTIEASKRKTKAAAEHARRPETRNTANRVPKPTPAIATPPHEAAAKVSSAPNDTVLRYLISLEKNLHGLVMKYYQSFLFAKRGWRILHCRRTSNSTHSSVIRNSE